MNTVNLLLKFHDKRKTNSIIIALLPELAPFFTFEIVLMEFMQFERFNLFNTGFVQYDVIKESDDRQFCSTFLCALSIYRFIS